LTSSLPLTGLGQTATCNRTGPSHMPRTLTARCVLLRSVKPTPISKHMLTIRTFLPAIMSTSNRMHGEFLRLLFLQAHRETEAHFTAAGMPSQRNQSESLRFKHAAFYQGLKSKVGLAAAKAAALRINLNVQDCSIVAAPMHALSRTSLLLPLLLSHNLPLTRVH
jgi:hypothetical protein